MFLRKIESIYVYILEREGGGEREGGERGRERKYNKFVKKLFD